MANRAPRTDEAKRLIEARERRGFKSATDACRRFGWNYSTYSQHERAERGLTKRSAAKYARAYRTSPSWLLLAEGPAITAVPIVGYVGAGQEVTPFDRDEFGEVDLPLGLAAESEAVVVRGDSMFPAFEPNDVLLYERKQTDIDNLVGRACVVQLADGRTFVKIIRPGRSRKLWTLASYNTPTLIENVRVEWAARIRWVEKR